METGIDKRISAGFCFEPAIAALCRSGGEGFGNRRRGGYRRIFPFQDGENLARYGETALGDLVADALNGRPGS